MKQTELKLIQGGAGETKTPPLIKKGTSKLEYVAVFAMSGVIWFALFFWIYRFFFH